MEVGQTPRSDHHRAHMWSADDQVEHICCDIRKIATKTGEMFSKEHVATNPCDLPNPNHPFRPILSKLRAPNHFRRSTFALLHDLLRRLPKSHGETLPRTSLVPGRHTIVPCLFCAEKALPRTHRSSGVRFPLVQTVIPARRVSDGRLGDTTAVRGDGIDLAPREGGALVVAAGKRVVLHALAARRGDGGGLLRQRQGVAVETWKDRNKNSCGWEGAFYQEIAVLFTRDTTR